MRGRYGALLIGVVVAAAWSLEGCSLSRIVKIPPVELSLADAGASEFDAQAGVPVRKTVQFSAADPSVNFASGSIEIDVDSISVTPTDTTGGKRLAAYQQGGEVTTCLTACEAGGVDATTCSNVCESGELAITAWVGSAADIIADCESGDEYNFRVTLDAEGGAVSVTASPSSLQPDTRALINAGATIGLCIEVVSPMDATVLIDSLTVHLSL